MNNKSLLNEKEAEVGINLQQPQDLINKAAQPARLVEGKSTLEYAVEQEFLAEPVFTDIQEFLRPAYHESIGRVVNGVLVSLHPTLEEYLEETYRKKIYQLGRSKRFLYLIKDRWALITPEAIKAEFTRQWGRRHAASMTRAILEQTVEVCQDFRQIIWNEDIKELHGKAVIA
jgi:hypothetical protein